MYCSANFYVKSIQTHRKYWTCTGRPVAQCIITPGSIKKTRLKYILFQSVTKKSRHIYLFIYTCTHAHMHTHTHTHTHTHKHMHAYTHTDARTHARARTHAGTHARAQVILNYIFFLKLSLKYFFFPGRYQREPRQEQMEMHL